VDDQRAGRSMRWSARIAFTTGVGASVAANIAAAQPDLGARIVAAWPAVALLLVVEMLARNGRAWVGEAAFPADRIRSASGDSSPAALAMVHPDNPADVAPDRTTAVESKDGSDSRLWRPHTPNVSDLDSQTPRSPRHRTSGTAAAVAKVHAERPDATAADIAHEVGVTERHVRRLMTSGLLHEEGVVVRDR
jgi:hypothetical protein